MFKTLVSLCFVFALTLVGCSKHPPTVTDTAPAASASSSASEAELMAARGPSRLQIKNSCSYDLWIQQQGMPAGTQASVLVKSGATTSYNIPAAGLASTRFWPKKGCDGTGNACSMGQSSPPCAPGGCTPPVDSKLEATWGCTLADKKLCGETPQHVRMIDTFWNASGVDGYTFPFTIKTSGGDGRAACIPVDCSALDLSNCPTNDNLSDNGANPAYASQNLNVVQLVDGGVPEGGVSEGCFSTCMKLNYPGWNGDGLNAPGGPVEKMYCCPTPPVSSPQCQAGPVPKTKYVTLIHTACKNTSYGYAYDDGLGGRTCSGDTILEMTVGPNCP
ncbi:MAG: hypothetical protein ACHREM_00130 [Polyangiales bacterium]